MIRRIDHIGLVSPSWQEARDVLLVKMGFPVSDWKGAGEKGTFFEPECTLNYFLQVGEGDTLIEIIVPQDGTSVRRGSLRNAAPACITSVMRLIASRTRRPDSVPRASAGSTSGQGQGRRSSSPATSTVSSPSWYRSSGRATGCIHSNGSDPAPLRLLITDPPLQ